MVRPEDRSLPEANSSVVVPKGVGTIRRFLAYAGPAYLVSVGYMDPGNWATDLKGGSVYGFALLWVILVSNIMAQVLQSLCAKLGIVTQKDLAQACRDYYKKPAAIALWLLCEIAIIACDLAEVVGSAVALQLLFGIDLIVGVLITSVDVLVLLALMRFGFRLLEAIIITLVTTIGACFAYDLYLAKPDWGGVGLGMVTPSMPDAQALVIAVGILGATVMPHNLYLHSSVVQTRALDRTPSGLRQAIKNNVADTVIALSLAFFVNAAILILSAAVFHERGMVVEELNDAHRLLQPFLGGAAATAFAVALLASGQSSTITGTLAGQIVMEGFLRIRVKPWLRRLATRLLAIVPAIILISASGGKGTVDLLIWSQVVLSMQLSFAIFPLMAFTSDKAKMGEFANRLPLKIVGYTCCALIASLNVYLLYQEIGALWVGIIAAAMALFSIWVTFFYKEKSTPPSGPGFELPEGAS